MNAAEFQTLSGASDAVMGDLARYGEMLTEGNAVMNLVGPATLPDFWRRHVLDSWQLLPLAPDALTWADLGTGAGLPGVVIAAFLKDRPGAHVHLVDSLGKRCRFLETVVQALSLPADVINGRAEDVRLTVDIATARAVAPMDRLLGYAEPLLKTGAQGLFLKGESVDDELVSARKSWKIDAVTYPSQSDDRGRVVRVTAARRLAPAGGRRGR